MEPKNKLGLEGLECRHEEERISKVQDGRGMNRDSLAFVIYMIHRCANQWGMPPSEVYQMLEKSGCIRMYLVPHYDVLHTQSSGYVLEDIQQYLRIRGVAV